MYKKPKIFFKEKWIVQYYYQPRSFMVFGMNKEERERIKNISIAQEVCGSFEEALKICKQLYKQNLLQYKH